MPSRPRTAILADSADLQHRGLKATLPRIKVLDVFRKAEQRHLSAEDVHRALVLAGSEVGLATIYRVLLQFEQAGLLTRNHFESGKALFEINEGHHHDHLVCVRCGDVVEFCDPQIEERQREVAAAHGFTLSDHALALYGVCSRPGCREEPL